MRHYRMEISPQTASDGSVYWSARFPTVPGCIVGGGDTPEEAIREAEGNLDVYIEYLVEEGLPIPAEDEPKQEYSGRIALRLSKSTHERVADRSRADGVSINLLINNAIEYYLGSLRS